LKTPLVCDRSCRIVIVDPFGIVVTQVERKSASSESFPSFTRPRITAATYVFVTLPMR